VAGYQVDNNYLQPWKARLYDEFGRHDLALQGDRTVFDRDGPRAEGPVEMAASRRESAYWLENMLVYHHFTTEEAAPVLGWSTEEVRKRADEPHFASQMKEVIPADGKTRVVPYPGGREVRMGFLDGNRDWQRGTKASVFLPWGCCTAAKGVVVWEVSSGRCGIGHLTCLRCASEADRRPKQSCT
jgi:hypothetical protein